MTIRFRFRTLDRFPRPLMTNRYHGPFRTTPSTAQGKVIYEAEKMGATEVYLLAACTAKEINSFGDLRHEAKLAHPGIVVHCEMPPVGEHARPPRRFCCDRFLRWESNMHAIGLTLERLRLAGIYGVMEEEEQYRGFEALPPGKSEPAEWRSAELALDFLLGCRGELDMSWDREDALRDPLKLQEIYRAVANRTHPDKGGDAKLFEKVNRAKVYIEMVKGWAA